MTEIRAALRELSGVADAAVEFSDDHPVGVRVRLEPGADERTVAESVQHVLTSYGLRSRLAPPRSKLEPVRPPPPPTFIRPAAAENQLPGARPESPEPVETPPEPQDADLPTEAPTSSGPAAESVPIAEVSVSETEHRVLVRVTDATGRWVERTARPAPSAVHEAIVVATAELVDPSGAPPGLALTEAREVSGVEVLTVVLEVGRGGLRAGSAVVGPGRYQAVASAAWAALRG
jgi:hypothetical protein